MMASTAFEVDAVISNVEKHLEREFDKWLSERLQVVPVVKPSTLQPHDKVFIVMVVFGSALLGALIPLVMK